MFVHTIWPLLRLLTDCFRRTQTQSLWDIIGWPSGWWGARIQEDQIESWRCSREECSDKFLGVWNLNGFVCVQHCWCYDSYEKSVTSAMFVLYKTGMFLMKNLSLLLCSYFIKHFREWILQQTSWGLWWGNGRHWLKLMWMWRLQTITPWGCSALDSPRGAKTKSRGPVMPSLAKLDRFVYCYLTKKNCFIEIN